MNNEQKAKIRFDILMANTHPEEEKVDEDIDILEVKGFESYTDSVVKLMEDLVKCVESERKIVVKKYDNENKGFYRSGILVTLLENSPNYKKGDICLIKDTAANGFMANSYMINGGENGNNLPEVELDKKEGNSFIRKANEDEIKKFALEYEGPLSLNS